MSQVQLFSHPELGELKATINNGEPWFLAGDVCRVLGIKNSARAVSEIDDKLKTAGVKGVGTADMLIDTAGGKQRAVIVSEQILYLWYNNKTQATTNYLGFYQY